MAMSSASVVVGLWVALSERNWKAVTAFLDDDCIYLDMPVGPTAAACGPENIVKRLKIGLEPLKDYVHHDGLIVANGDDVMYEHSETWTFATGEVLELPFVSVHRVRDGQVSLWKDYWDYAALTSAAPAAWLEGLATADTSWLFDASGLV